MDVISDVLRTVRVESARFVARELRGPFCVDPVADPELGREPGRVVWVHFVLEGSCRIEVSGGAPLHLDAGGVAALPRGAAHRLSGAERTVLVSASLALGRELPSPLVEALPELVSASALARGSAGFVEHSIRYALEQGAQGQAGASLVVAKVAEALLVEALRAYIEAGPSSRAGWLAGVQDPQIARCLALLHADPARPWTVAELARRVHMSRSALAQRFTELVGMGPMQYLKRWRLAIAEDLLRDEHTTLAHVAENVGYESDAGFNRAFKREYGVSPGLWRRRRLLLERSRATTASAA